LSGDFSPSIVLPPTREPRAVGARQPLVWFAEAMRLWKRGPVIFAALAFMTILASVALDGVPVVGFIVGKIVAPLLGTGMLFASLAADRGDRPRLKHALAAFATKPGAQAAVVFASLATFAVEAYAARYLADVNLFSPPRGGPNFSLAVIAGIYAAGVLASLPLTFVPFVAMFDGERANRAFAASARAFARNVPALALYGGLSFALLLIGLATMGIGLVLVLPWIAAASYAGWKDIFAVAASSGTANASRS